MKHNTLYRLPAKGPIKGYAVMIHFPVVVSEKEVTSKDWAQLRRTFLTHTRWVAGDLLHEAFKAKGR